VASVSISLVKRPDALPAAPQSLTAYPLLYAKMKKVRGFAPLAFELYKRAGYPAMTYLQLNSLRHTQCCHHLVHADQQAI
jgi:hypothetical protein